MSVFSPECSHWGMTGSSHLYTSCFNVQHPIIFTVFPIYQVFPAFLVFPISQVFLAFLVFPIYLIFAAFLVFPNSLIMEDSPDLLNLPRLHNFPDLHNFPAILGHPRFPDPPNFPFLPVCPEVLPETRVGLCGMRIDRREMSPSGSLTRPSLPLAGLVSGTLCLQWLHALLTGWPVISVDK